MRLVGSSQSEAVELQVRSVKRMKIWDRTHTRYSRSLRKKWRFRQNRYFSIIFSSLWISLTWSLRNVNRIPIFLRVFESWSIIIKRLLKRTEFKIKASIWTRSIILRKTILFLTQKSSQPQERLFKTVRSPYDQITQNSIWVIKRSRLCLLRTYIQKYQVKQQEDRCLMFLDQGQFDQRQGLTTRLRTILEKDRLDEMRLLSSSLKEDFQSKEWWMILIEIQSLEVLCLRSKFSLRTPFSRLFWSLKSRLGKRSRRKVRASYLFHLNLSPFECLQRNLNSSHPCPQPETQCWKNETNEDDQLESKMFLTPNLKT